MRSPAGLLLYHRLCSVSGLGHVDLRCYRAIWRAHHPKPGLAGLWEACAEEISACVSGIHALVDKEVHSKETLQPAHKCAVSMATPVFTCGLSWSLTTN
jgi:hypothetical protein